MYSVFIVENLETFLKYKDNNENKPVPAINVIYVMKMRLSSSLSFFSMRWLKHFFDHIFHLNFNTAWNSIMNLFKSI